MARDCVRAVNGQKDKNGLSYARKAMIQCGLALGVNGIWEVTQLKPELQQIIRKYRNHFEGEAVPLP